MNKKLAAFLVTVGLLVGFAGGATYSNEEACRVLAFSLTNFDALNYYQFWGELPSEEMIVERQVTYFKGCEVIYNQPSVVTVKAVKPLAGRIWDNISEKMEGISIFGNK